MLTFDPIPLTFPELTLFIFCLMLACTTGWVSVQNYKQRKIDGLDALAPRKTKLGQQHLSSQLAIFLLVATLLWWCGWSVGDLGVSTKVPGIAAFAIGIVVYIVLLILLEVMSAILGVREQLHDVSFLILRFVWPRERTGKWQAVIAVCLLNPITEEVVFRGILIYAAAEHFGYLPIVVIIGLVLSIIAHLYQGPMALLSQILFHSAAVALLLSPAGLFAAIGFHFAGDIVPIATMRPAMHRWSRRRRDARALR